MSAAKSISQNLDPKVFPEIRQVKWLYAENVRQIETVASVVTFTGFVALALAGVGLVGLVSFTVSQKTKEIAIRTALGASGANVLTVCSGSSPGRLGSDFSSEPQQLLSRLKCCVALSTASAISIRSATREQ